MPEMNPQFTLEAPIDTVWDHLTDMRNISSCIPGCTVETVDDTTSLWRVAIEVGFFKKTLTLTNKVTAKDDTNHHIEFEASGDGITAKGRGDLYAEGPNKTQIDFHMDIGAHGLGAGMINGVIASTTEQCTTDFIAAAKEALE